MLIFVKGVNSMNEDTIIIPNEFPNNGAVGGQTVDLTETPKMGRPTDYDPIFISKVDEYLEACKDEEYDWTKSTSSGKVDSESWEHRIKVHLPTMEDFALFINVSRSTVYEWKEKYKDFSDSLDKILIEQKKRLLNKGLSGDYNPTIAKLILSSNNGMKEKTEQDITSGGKSIGGFNFIRNDGDNNTDNKTN